MTEADRVEPIWGVCANIVLSRPYGPGGQERREGTKHFAPGAKVHVFQRIGWSNCRRVRIYGRHRVSGRRIEVTTGVEFLANWRAELVYSPRLIRKILDDMTMTPGRAQELQSMLGSGLYRECPEIAEVLRARCVRVNEDRAAWLAWAAGDGGRDAAECFVAWMSRLGAGSQPFVTRPPGG